MSTEHGSATEQVLSAQIERMLQPCTWFDDEDHGKFDTGCGHEFTFIDDGIAENGFKHCPYCGGPITT